MDKNNLTDNQLIILRYLDHATTTPASKDLKVCHAGLDPASSLLNGCCLRK
jgi:hypothetical protein